MDRVDSDLESPRGPADGLFAALFVVTKATPLPSPHVPAPEPQLPTADSSFLGTPMTPPLQPKSPRGAVPDWDRQPSHHLDTPTTPPQPLVSPRGAPPKSPRGAPPKSPRGPAGNACPPKSPRGGGADLSAGAPMKSPRGPPLVPSLLVPGAREAPGPAPGAGPESGSDATETETSASSASRSGSDAASDAGSGDASDAGSEAEQEDPSSPVNPWDNSTRGFDASESSGSSCSSSSSAASEAASSRTASSSDASSTSPGSARPTCSRTTASEAPSMEGLQLLTESSEGDLEFVALVVALQDAARAPQKAPTSAWAGLQLLRWACDPGPQDEWAYRVTMLPGVAGPEPPAATNPPLLPLPGDVPVLPLALGQGAMQGPQAEQQEAPADWQQPPSEGQAQAEVGGQEVEVTATESSGPPAGPGTVPMPMPAPRPSEEEPAPGPPLFRSLAALLATTGLIFPRDATPEGLVLLQQLHHRETDDVPQFEKLCLASAQTGTLNSYGLRCLQVCACVTPIFVFAFVCVCVCVCVCGCVDF